MIAFSCSKCGKQFNLKPEFAGRKTTCSGCKEPLVVPAPKDAAAPLAAAKIEFSCERCRMKFRVPAECAGRKTTCPSCKEPMVVPTAEQTVAYVPPPGEIRGAPSSLARAGVDVNVTLGSGLPQNGAARHTPLQNLLDGKAKSGQRYVVESELARGGMGAVMRAVDCDIRREVAVKYLLDQCDDKKKFRFVEEAQITGQLEHPNIVPIHELGVDAENRIFFSMKMVNGRSLAEILKMLRGDASEAKDFSQGRLLNIFVSICNALAYAHSRGVVHRDLKPANIMVGDFGEVYVMDWGLAKVLDQGVVAPGPAIAIPVATPAGPFDFAAAAPLATPVEPTETASGSGSGKVVTIREQDADLTQEGAVLGTPVYMPPEQASGKVSEIDERSDIYSMGAILYEILALQPPISKEGGYWPILMRVTQGQIEPPESKAPERKIPPELSAIAMKALAKKKEDRYRTVEMLRKDIERFMDGRSVSAKQDTIRETAVKLVKRNKGVSIATAAAALILAVGGFWSLIAILVANARTQKAYDDYRAEQLAKREQGKRSVPAFIRVARGMINDKQFEDAHAHLNMALNFDENEPDGRFLRATLLLGKLDFNAAQTDLEACLKQQPQRAEAKALLELVRGARPERKEDLLALADELSQQGAFALAIQITRQAEKLVESSEELLPHYRQRIEAAWPGLGASLKLDAGGKYALDLQKRQEVSDLTPLQGMKLSTLNISGCPVQDLTPLHGMTLVELKIDQCPVKDLTPLKGMPLTALHLENCSQIRDLAPLKGMSLTSLNLSGCQKISDLAPLKGMSLTSLWLTECIYVRNLTPLKGMPLKILSLWGCPVEDLTPLKGMPLRTLSLQRCLQLRDLGPLKDMPLTTLVLIECMNVSDLTPLKGMQLNDLLIPGPVSDLTPLKGMPLTTLQLWNTANVTDLTPLKGMPLTKLTMTGVPVADLRALKGMPLKSVNLDNCGKITDLTPLAGMELTDVSIAGCPVKDLTPLRGMPIVSINMGGCQDLHDLTPLAGMKLTSVNLPPQVTMGMDMLRDIKTLMSIDYMPPEQFWKRWDAKAKAK